MPGLINSSVAAYMRYRMQGIDSIRLRGPELQAQIFEQLIRSGQSTVWGRQYGFEDLRNVHDFQKRVPVQHYDDLQPYIERMMHGEASVLWPGRVRFFSKSAGTTKDKSKFSPISRQNMVQCHIRGTWDTTTTYYDNYPDATLFAKKSILIGGTAKKQKGNSRAIIGDVSSLMMYNMPFIARPFSALDADTFSIKDWEEKVERIAELGSRDPDVVMCGGVPTWWIPIFNRILEKTGKDNLLEVWPDFQVYIHGGVSFEVYRSVFAHYFPSDQVHYQEIYNASEGYFALQDDLTDDSLLLLLRNGMFFEFIPLSELDQAFPAALTIADVALGVPYALCVSNNAGLWRYMVGDVVTFTSRYPFKIKITGRTKLFINTFGEELMIHNAEQALAETCQLLGVEVAEFTVAPIFLNQNDKGRHQWYIEFVKPPSDVDCFSEILDQRLKAANSDYEAKRSKDIVLYPPLITSVPQGTFNQWCSQNAKLGGQNKIPRLFPTREIAEELSAIVEDKA